MIRGSGFGVRGSRFVSGMKSFRELEVWQVGMALTRDVYEILKSFPLEERYALCDQIRRSAVSVVSNIAEGFGRDSTKDYLHFLAMSRGSLFELETQLELAESIGYVIISKEIRDKIYHVGRMLNSLSAKLKARITNPKPRTPND